MLYSPAQRPLSLLQHMRAYQRAWAMLWIAQKLRVPTRTGAGRCPRAGRAVGMQRNSEDTSRERGEHLSAGDALAAGGGGGAEVDGA